VKREQYKSIAALQAVLLFSHTSRRIELHERGVRSEVVTDGQRIELACIGVDLALSSIYADAGLWTPRRFD